MRCLVSDIQKQWAVRRQSHRQDLVVRHIPRIEILMQKTEHETYESPAPSALVSAWRSTTAAASRPNSVVECVPFSQSTCSKCDPPAASRCRSIGCPTGGARYCASMPALPSTPGHQPPDSVSAFIAIWCVQWSPPPRYLPKKLSKPRWVGVHFLAA